MGIHQRSSVARALTEWIASGTSPALATVVRSTSSAPRGLGAQLAVAPSGSSWTGGLSGGCAEVEVLEAARHVLDPNGPEAVLLELTRDDLGSVGPVCGATLTVVVERVAPGLAANYAVAVAAAARGASNTLHRSWEFEPEGGSWRTLKTGKSKLRPHATPVADAVTCTIDDTTCTAAFTWAPPPRLIIGGSGDVAVELVAQARRLGWRWALVDPRESFLDASLELLGIERGIRGNVPHEPAAAVISSWPEAALDELSVGGRDLIVTCAHDSKLDMPMLLAAVQSDAHYVGSVGSRAVQEERTAMLVEHAGADAADRHHGPAGLDLGGGDAAEIALSIVAEAMAVTNGRAGGMLQHQQTPIRAQ